MSEKWDVFDVNRNPMGYTKSEEDCFTKHEYRLGASLWIVNSDKKFLIQKRALGKINSPNKWSITGGKVKAGESSISACIREAKEEIGIEFDSKDITFLYRSVGENMIFEDYIVLADVSMDAISRNASEVSDIKWADSTEILDLYYMNEFMYNNINDFKIVLDYLAERHMDARR